MQYAAICDGMTVLVDYSLESGMSTVGSEEERMDENVRVLLTLDENRRYLDTVRDALKQLAPFQPGQTTIRNESLVTHAVIEDKGMVYFCVWDITDISSAPHKAFKFLRRIRKQFKNKHELENRPAVPKWWGATISFAYELSQLMIKETSGRGRASSVAMSHRGSDASLVGDAQPLPAGGGDNAEIVDNKPGPLKAAGHRRRNSRSTNDLKEPPMTPPGVQNALVRTASTPLIVRASHASANTGIPADTLANMMSELGVSNFHDADSFAHATGTQRGDDTISLSPTELADLLADKKTALVEHHKLVQYSPVPQNETERMGHISLLRETLLKMLEYDLHAKQYDASVLANNPSGKGSSSDNDIKFVRNSLVKHAGRLHDHYFPDSANSVRDGLSDIWGLPFILQSTSTVVHVVDCLCSIVASRVFTNDESTWIDAVYSHVIGPDATQLAFEVTINGVETNTTSLQPIGAQNVFETDYWPEEVTGICDGVVRFLIKDLPPKAEVRVTITYAKRMRPLADPNTDPGTSAGVALGSLVPPIPLIRPEGMDEDLGLSLGPNTQNATLVIHLALPGDIEGVYVGHHCATFRVNDRDTTRGILSLTLALNDPSDLYLTVQSKGLAIPRGWYLDYSDASDASKAQRLGIAFCPSTMAPDPTVDDHAGTGADEGGSPASPTDGGRRDQQDVAQATEWVLLIGRALSPQDLRGIIEGVHVFLRSLPQRSLFNIITFGASGPETLFETGSVVLNNDSLSAASKFLDTRIKADTHTNLCLALEAANMTPPHASVPRQVVIITGESPPSDLPSALVTLREHYDDCDTQVIVVAETSHKGNDSKSTTVVPMSPVLTDATGISPPPYAACLRDALGARFTPGSLMMASGEFDVGTRLLSLLEVHDYATARNLNVSWGGVSATTDMPSRNIHVFRDRFETVFSFQHVTPSERADPTVTIKAETRDRSGTLWTDLPMRAIPFENVAKHAILADYAGLAARTSLLTEDQDSTKLPWMYGVVKQENQLLAGEMTSRAKIYQLNAICSRSSTSSKSGTKSRTTSAADTLSVTASPGDVNTTADAVTAKPLTPTGPAADVPPPKQRKRRSGSVFSRAANAIRRKSAFTILPWQTSHALVAKDRPLVDLIKIQAADGSWASTEATAAFLGVKPEPLRRLMPGYLSDISDKVKSSTAIWQTALASEYIRIKTLPGAVSRWNNGSAATYARVLKKAKGYIEGEISNWSLELVEPDIRKAIFEHASLCLTESRKASSSSSPAATPASATSSPVAAVASPASSGVESSVDESEHAKSRTSSSVDGTTTTTEPAPESPSASVTITLSSQSPIGSTQEEATESPGSTHEASSGAE